MPRSLNGKAEKIKKGEVGDIPSPFTVIIIAHIEKKNN
jgi:hypothetical protein